MVRIDKTEINDLKAMLDAVSILQPVNIEIYRDIYNPTEDQPAGILNISIKGKTNRVATLSMVDQGNGTRIPVLIQPLNGVTITAFNALTVYNDDHWLNQ